MNTKTTVSLLPHQKLGGCLQSIKLTPGMLSTGVSVSSASEDINVVGSQSTCIVVKLRRCGFKQMVYMYIHVLYMRYR